MSVRLKAFVLSLVLVAGFSAQARHHNNRGNQNSGSAGSNNSDNQKDPSNSSSAVSTGSAADDSQIVQAMQNQDRVNFVEGANMVVTKLLPDDTQGLQHQKWIVRLSNGTTMQAVYNTDMCPRVPVKVGDVVSMGGQFIWTGGGGLLHWLHKDPRGSRPDGYVFLNGQFYCK